MFKGGKLQKAKRALNKRKFSFVISMLEPLVIEYGNSFDYFYTLGTACLYVGDIGGAQTYYQKARNIKMRDVNLILAQAVLHLRRGNISQAVECYLEAQELEPKNRVAKKALNFIRKNGEKNVISEWVSEGKISAFYPPLGLPFGIFEIAALLIICITLTFAGLGTYSHLKNKNIARQDVRFLNLTSEESLNSVEKNMSGSYRYILTSKQINDSYEAAQKYFQSYRDNAAQVEVNRILLSNAALFVKQKAKTLESYLKKEPVFDDNLKDNYTYAQIESEPFLYENCFVVWSGRVTNVRMNSTIYECDFLVGYDNMTRIDGIVTFTINQPISINPEKPLKIFAKIAIKNGKIILIGQAVFQSIK